MWEVGQGKCGRLPAQAPTLRAMRDLARRDFAALERDGYVIRDDLQPEAAKAWRHAIVGLGHGAGVRVDTGELGRTGAWASINRDSPPDLRRRAW